MNNKPKQEVIDDRELEKENFTRVKNQKNTNFLDNFKPLLYLLAPILVFLLLAPILLFILGIYSYKKYKGETRPAYATFKWFYDKRKYLNFFR